MICIEDLYSRSTPASRTNRAIIPAGDDLHLDLKNECAPLSSLIVIKFSNVSAFSVLLRSGGDEHTGGAAHRQLAIYGPGAGKNNSH